MERSTESYHRSKQLDRLADTKIQTLILIEINKAWPLKIGIADLPICQDLKTRARLTGYKYLLFRQPKGFGIRGFWVHNKTVQIAEKSIGVGCSKLDPYQWKK